jgi:hypothetical protein
VKSPKVGIFWLVKGRLLIDSTPVHEAEDYGECKNHPRGHIDRWRQMQMAGMVPYKIDRADKHIAELNAAIVALKDNYTASVEQSEAGHQSLIHACPELQDAFRNLALIIGDAIHNLRAALEFAWIATLEKQHIPYDPKHVSFPIRDNLQDVEGALNGIKVNTLSPKLYDQIVKGTQPCREGKG